MKTDSEWRQLRVGDRIRLIEIPLDFLDWSALHIETKQAYEYLFARRKPVTVYRIDDDGFPWIRFQFRDTDGRMRYDYLMINHGGLAVVQPRKQSRANR